MFNGSRFALARKRRSLTKKALAELIDLDPKSISRYEANEKSPSASTLAKLVDCLAFPIEFFSGEDIDAPSERGVSFRSMSRVPALLRDSALSSGAFAYMLSDFVDEQFVFPELDILELRGESPAGAAAYLRQYWGIGERPIKNVVNLLEAKGVRVFSLAENCNEIDAYSIWRGDRPYVFLNTLKSAEHSRFDAAHELGHIALHKHGSPAGRDAEREADDFAAAFLMPESQIVASAPYDPTLERLIELKIPWKVSLVALVVRLHRLGLLSDWKYRALCIEIQRREYRKNEPEPTQRETSEVWHTVFADLKKDGISKEQVADKLALPTREIESLVFGLVMMGISSSQYTTRKNPRRTRNHLTLVK